MTQSCAAPIVQGWCPGALRPMMSGDGLVVRIRAPLGRLSSAQALGIARCSHDLGNGFLDLSARANLQMRGVQQDNHAALIDKLRGLSLIDSNAEVEARRNITLTPFWTPEDDSVTIARLLTEALAQPDAPQTPGKFGYVVDCGPVPVLGAVAGDIRFERAASGQLICRPDGSNLAVPVRVDTAAATGLCLAQWFLDSGGAPDNRGRMAALIAKGVAPTGYCATVLHPDGAMPKPGLVPQGALLALEFGQLTSDALGRLAGFGALRLTPWRMILVESCTKLPDLAGTITDASDPALRISACTGAPGCPQALSQTRALARQLAPALPAQDSLHISGCAKGCAHPGAASVTLTATGPTHFDLIRNGTASDPPELVGLAPSDLPQHISRKGP